VEELESWKDEVLEMRAKLSQQEFEARLRTEAILQQLVIACRQVGELEKREVKASEELDGLRSEVALLRNEVLRLKDEIAEKKGVGGAGKRRENDEKVANLVERGVVEENLKLAKEEDSKPGNLEVVGEFSIEVSSDEETKASDEGKLIIDETPKCEEEVLGKKSLTKQVSKATPVKRKTPVKKAMAQEGNGSQEETLH